MENAFCVCCVLCCNILLLPTIVWSLVLPIDIERAQPLKKTALSTTATIDYHPDPELPDFTPECLQCICHASSLCDFKLQCRTTRTGSLLCGPYYMTLNYWKDAGQFGPDLDARKTTNLFRTCATEKECADKTVTSYMRRYVKDCDQDGEITCFDYARIHTAGPGGCSKNDFLTTRYWKNFQQCYAYSPELDPRKILDHRGNI